MTSLGNAFSAGLQLTDNQNVVIAKVHKMSYSLIVQHVRDHYVEGIANEENNRA